MPHFLKHYQNDLSNLFVSTDGFQACDDTLHEHHVLMVTGAPGSGKTMIAQQLTVKLWDVNKCHPFRVTKPSEYSDNCNPRIPQVFQIDDVFGSSNFVQVKYDEWVSVFGNMRDDLRSSNTFIIFTSRDNILKANLSDLKNYEVFRHVINLSDTQFKLSEENMSDMFENHAKANHIDLSYNDTVDYSQIIGEVMGYPQRVRLLCAMRDVPNDARLRYFNRPMEFLSNIIGSYKEKDHLSYCIIILLLMNDGKLPISFFDASNKSSTHVQTCFDICDLPSTTTMGALRATAKHLCGCFLVLYDDCFIPQHESIMEAATLDFGQNYPSEIIDRCSVQFLMERVFTNNSAPTDNEYVVIVQEKMFPQLVTRLVKEIQTCLYIVSGESCGEGDFDSLRALATYRIFRDPAVNHVFMKHLEQTSYLHLLLTPSLPGSQKPTFLFFTALSGQETLIQEVLSSYLHGLRELVGFRDYLDRVLSAACYSGSAMAVEALLLAGARSDCRTAYAPDDMIFSKEHQTSTTVMHAAYSGSVEVLRLICNDMRRRLVDVEEHLKIRDTWGNTAMLWWVHGGRGIAALQFLLDAGADVNTRDEGGRTALYQRAQQGDEIAVTALVDAGVDVNVLDRNGGTILQLSARNNYANIVDILVKAGADFNVVSGYGGTALNLATGCDNVYIVRYLVDAGADIHLVHNGMTPLEYAVFCKATAVADFLVSLITTDNLDRWPVSILVEHVFTRESAPPDKTPAVIIQPEAFSVLCTQLVKEIQRCVTVDDDRALRSLSGYRVFRDTLFIPVFIQHLQQTNTFQILITSSSPDSQHLTFLFRAAASGQEALIKEVLSFELRDVRRLRGVRDHLDHIMYAACCSGSSLAVSVLLLSGVRADYMKAHRPDHVRDGRCDSNGNWDKRPICTTLMHAAFTGSVVVLRLVFDWLQKQRVNVAEHICLRDRLGMNALHWWARGGRDVNALQILLEAGADVNATDLSGRTVLIWGVLYCDVVSIRAIIEAGADVNACNLDGQTALYLSAEKGEEATVRVLLKAGADINAARFDGETALHMSTYRHHTTVVRILLEAGANVNARNEQGLTSLHNAVEYDHATVIRLLVEAGANIDIEDASSPVQIAIEQKNTAVLDLLLGPSMAEDILGHCPVEFLVWHVLTKHSVASDNKNVIVLQAKMFPQLCTRLVKEIQGCIKRAVSYDRDDRCNLSSLTAYRVFRDHAFIHVFLRHLQQTDSLHLLLTSSSRSYPDPTFLFLAAASGHDALVQEVISSYLNDLHRLPGFSDHLDRVLYAACNAGSPATVRALLAAGARVDYKTAYDPELVKYGVLISNVPTATTLMHAAYSGSVDVLRIILDHLHEQRVDVEEHIGANDGLASKALHYAAGKGRGALPLQILLKAGANVNAMSSASESALHRSARRGDDDAVRVLLTAGANINVADKQGQTALHLAVQDGYAVTASLLVEAGADIHAKVGSSSPLEVAIRCMHTALADILLSLSTTDVLLSRCSVDFLLRHVVTKDPASSDTKYVIALHNDKFSQLCKRLVQEIQICYAKGDYPSLMSLSDYRVFRDCAFLCIFLDHLHEMDSFRILLTSSSQHPTFLFLAALSGQDTLVQYVLSTYLSDVQRQAGFRDHLDRVLCAACYVGSPTTVRTLLAAGARANYTTAYDPDDVSAQMEARTGRARIPGYFGPDLWKPPPVCTTLMHAAHSGSVGVLRLILDHLQQQRVNIAEIARIRNGRGMTALEILLEAWFGRKNDDTSRASGGEV